MKSVEGCATRRATMPPIPHLWPVVQTTLLRHLAQRAIKGIPDNCQILHVEQEVGGFV